MISKSRKIDASVYRGPLGDFVNLVSPQSESHPVALLLQSLVFFGNLVGNKAYFQHESTKHHANLFLCLVGRSSKGRKGTSLDHVRNLFCQIDPAWSKTRVKSGLSSGEGLIYNVRDPNPQKEDPGESDKRLLALQGEFATVLKNFDRNGNNLSAILRDAYDSTVLSTLVKNDPNKATESHISIVAHITEDEIHRTLTATEMANGFANRFLFASVHRAQFLPDGGFVDPQKLAPIVSDLKDAVEFAEDCGQVRRDEGASELWRREYSKLSDDVPGLLGSVTARGEAQVTRLALIYALLERSKLITTSHLAAALSVWDYCFNSCRNIFGESTGDLAADIILEALSESSQGMSRSDIRDLFQRHKSGLEIDRALNTLSQLGKAIVVENSTAGRKAHVWLCTKHATKATEATKGYNSSLKSLSSHPQGVIL